MPGREPLEGRRIARVAANPLDPGVQPVGLLAPGQDGQGVARATASEAQAVERLPVPPRNRIFTLGC